MNKDLIKYSLKSLNERKMRSFLTILSVLIGIMAIFALISFGQGLSKYAGDISKKMGADKVILQPTLGAIPDSAFSSEDVEFVRKIKGIEELAEMPVESVMVQQKEGSTPKYTYAMGYSADNQIKELVSELMTVKLEKGRELRKGDRMKAVAGNLYSQPNKIFEKPIDIGDKILVNDHVVEIVGIYEPIGNPRDDSTLYFTLEGMEDLTGKNDEFEYMFIRASIGVDPTSLAEKIKDDFRRFKGQDKGKEDFTVQTLEDMIESFSTVLNVINGVLVVIALVSVLISAINIMNTMYTSVLERTKDIGIMKAIGARNSDIMIIFIIESGILGFIGGIIGVALGYGVASLGGYIATVSGYSSLQPYFSLELIIGCIVFASAVGAVSGLAPAVQASKHKPVDSLRYE